MTIVVLVGLENASADLVGQHGGRADPRPLRIAHRRRAPHRVPGGYGGGQDTCRRPGRRARRLLERVEEGRPPRVRARPPDEGLARDGPEVDGQGPGGRVGGGEGGQVVQGGQRDVAFFY